MTGNDCISKKIIDYKGKRTWHSEIVWGERDIPFYEFYYKHSEYDTVIDPRLIVGTTHHGYSGSQWSVMLQSLKRLYYYNSKDINAIVGVINNDKLDEVKTLLKYGDHFLICAGNHRICISKFLELSEITCRVIEYKLSDNELGMYITLLELGFNVNYENGRFTSIYYNGTSFSTQPTMERINLLINTFRVIKSESKLKQHAILLLHKFKTHNYKSRPTFVSIPLNNCKRDMAQFKHELRLIYILSKK